jgi:hypothetical protein
VLSLDVDGGVDGDWERGALGASAAAALQRLPRDRKLPCELTLRFARAMVLRSLHASSSARHVELYTLEKVDGGGALARTYVGTARGVRRESSGGGVAYDATQTLKRPTRCDGVAVRFVSLQDDKNRAQIAAIVVRAAEAPAVSAAAAAPANKSERRRIIVVVRTLRLYLSCCDSVELALQRLKQCTQRTTMLLRERRVCSRNQQQAGERRGHRTIL